MAIMFDVPADELIEKVTEKLKQINEIKPPEWAVFVKTGRHRERVPLRGDWWYVRAASVLRTIYKLGPIGVSKLRKKYGGKKNRGNKPERFYKGSGSIIRKILQQLESAELVKTEKKKIRRGRILSSKGKSLLDKTAKGILRTMPKKEVPKQEIPKKEKTKEKVEEKPKEVKKEKPIEKEDKKEKPKDKPKEEAKGEKPIKKESLDKKPIEKKKEKTIKKEEPKKNG